MAAVCLNTALTPCKMCATTITITAHLAIQTTNHQHHHHSSCIAHIYHHNNATTITNTTATPCIAHMWCICVRVCVHIIICILQHLWCAQCALWCVCARQHHNIKHTPGAVMMGSHNTCCMLPLGTSKTACCTHVHREHTHQSLIPTDCGACDRTVATSYVQASPLNVCDQKGNSTDL